MFSRVTILCNKYDGHPKGFAYVEFTDKDSVQTAMALDDSLFRGRQIKVILKEIHGINSIHYPIRWCLRGPTSRGSHQPTGLLEVAAGSGPGEAEAGGLGEGTWGVLAAATEGDTEEDTPLTEEHYVTPINWALSMNYDTVLITIVVWNFQVFQLLTYESFFRSARVIAQELYKAGW